MSKDTYLLRHANTGIKGQEIISRLTILRIAEGKKIGMIRNYISAINRNFLRNTSSPRLIFMEITLPRRLDSPP